MPSLPVNNQCLASNEDAYRRYFGALKKSSPAKPRLLLLIALIKVCCFSLAASIPNFVLLFYRYKKPGIFKSERLYYLYNFTQMIITFIWCLSVIHVIFKHKYANFKIMFVNATIISIISFCISTYLSILHHIQHEATINTHTAFWEKEYWRLDIIYFTVIRFPLTLYFSILTMYLSQYCCSNSCIFLVTSRMDSVYKNEQYQEKLINVPANDAPKESVEVFEYVSNTTGSIYGDDIELSLDTDIQNGAGYDIQRADSVQTVSFQELEISARSVIRKYMLWYCFIFTVALFLWFLIATTNPTKYDDYRSIWYLSLILVYYIAKWRLKQSARHIDTAIIIPNFSFEIITEILMSSFYWCNFRMFTIKYQFRPHSYWSFPIIAIIHIFSEIFQDSIRMSAGYFNWTGNVSREKKSNITQWKVRGAIDTSIRFIISVYSILFVTIRYSMDSYPQFNNANTRNSIILNYSIFAIELIYFSFIIFKPGCAGKISEQQQINMAEPLMRMFNANSYLFLGVFCGSMVMASLLVI